MKKVKVWFLNMHSTPHAWKYDFKEFKYDICLWKEALKPKNVKVKWMGYLAKDVNVQVKLMKGFMWKRTILSQWNKC